MSDLTLRFEVAGAPVPKGRHRTGRGRTYTPQRTVDAEKHVGWAFRARYPGWQPDAEHKWAVDVEFFVRKQRGDCDNLLKLILDAMNGLVFKDDRQVWSIRASVFEGYTRQYTAVELQAIKPHEVDPAREAEALP